VHVTEPPDGQHEPVNTGEVAVPTGKLDEIRRLILGAVLGGALVALAFIWFAGTQARTNSHLGRTDAALAQFISAEIAEEERERASACVDAHERYAEFEHLAAGLTEAGATVGTEAHLNLMGNSTEADRAAAQAEIDSLLPGEIAPLLAEYPPPGCDLEDAAALLAQPAPRPPDVEDLIDAG
jgi:hypothetical protein